MSEAERRQIEMLREIGISPVWQLRDVGEQAGAEPAAADTADSVRPVAGAVLAQAAARAPEPSPISTDMPVAAAQALSGDVTSMDWPALKACVADCRSCALHKDRNRTVFGVGDESAGWLFVGEGPGADEDRAGEPFVGQAGKLLDNMLAAINLRRGDNVYIANIVKCRPPGNRNPQAEEVAACSAYLARQIALIKPRLIVALGKVAAVNLLGRDASISGLRGTVHQYQGIPLIVTYHPAYLLRTLPDKAKAWEDLCFAVETMASLRAEQPGAV